ncbi:molecular chaperone [Leadbetterella sp. DM7]|uniref:fimbrial biogenesis chaperone n=1 Tax=Leadbetterella sp. DM7 TaxID=3235085 RepID=UPI00349EC8A3
MKTSFLTFCLLWGSVIFCNAQTGISVSPPRVYFETAPGQTAVEKVSITNASKSTVLDLSISLADWAYNENGDNLILPADSLSNSFAKWVTISEGSYFSLKPEETRDLTINVNIPAIVDPKTTVYTALLFVTQMNPVDDVNAQGSQIKLSVRSGIKLYCRPTGLAKVKKLEITDLKFDSKEGGLALAFQNQGNVWTDGVIYTDLLNTGTGKSVKIEEAGFRTLPGDKRVVKIPLPKDLAKGNYTATIMMDFGSDSEMEAAELKFTYE